MLKKKMVFGLSSAAALFLSCTAMAVTPSQLTAPFFADKANVGIEITDIEKLMSDTTPLSQLFTHLLLPLGKESVPAEVMNKPNIVKSFIGRIHFDDEFSDFQDNIWAIELSEPLPAPEAGTAGFTLEKQPPEGTELTPYKLAVSKGETEEEKKEEEKYYMAQMKRGGQNFLLIATSPDLLSEMAAVPDDAKVDEHHLQGPLWFSVNKTPSKIGETLDTNLTPEVLSGPVRAEIAITDTERSLQVNMMAALPEKQQNAGQAEAPVYSAPLLVGSSPIISLLSFENLLNDTDVAKIADSFKGELESVGLTADDLKTILKSRVTLGVAGKTTIMMGEVMLGEFPGLYLHLNGADDQTSKKLRTLFESTLTGMLQAKTEPLTQGEWTGSGTAKGSMVGAYAVSGKGLLIGVQNPAELQQTPQPADDMEAVLDKNPQFTLNIDFAALHALAAELLEKYGDDFFTEEKAGYRPMAELAIEVLNAFGVLNATASTDARTFNAELFVKPAEFKAILDQTASLFTSGN